MKPSLAVLFVLFPMLLAAQSGKKTARTHTPCVLPAGTAIVLESADSLSSELARMGDIVQFAVAEEVRQNKTILIRHGATAYARVLRVVPTTYNRPEYIVIEVTCVSAVDGQMIDVNSRYMEIAADIPGVNAKLKPGKRALAYTANDAFIRI
ncbi:MAG: hypothetical protein KF852_06115 [Saprospiraceae bacterium]|nr:hypothetical protein [Saprospiraceae bacterium]